MKKLLSIFSALMIIFTFSLPAFATDTADTIDTSTWITHEIPELGISLALPQGTKVYTRDSLAKGNLDNDPNYDEAVKDLSKDYRYCWAVNEKEHLDLDFRISHKPAHIYPFCSLKTLPEPLMSKLLNRLNSSCTGNNLYSTLSIGNNMYMVYPYRYNDSRTYIYYLYNSRINNISYCFDFRMEADSGVDKPTKIYNAILSTVDFSNVPTDIYSSLPVLLVLLLAAVFLIYRFVKYRKRSNLLN
ncbi:MAG: hypothetical protein RR273_06425 [Oscillospiraceae bacterium]